MIYPGECSCALENVYSVVVISTVFLVFGDQKVSPICLYMSPRSICSTVWFNSNVFLLIFCLHNLSIADSGILKSLTVIVLLYSPPLGVVSICIIYFGAQMLEVYIFIIAIIFLMNRGSLTSDGLTYGFLTF